MKGSQKRIGFAARAFSLTLSLIGANLILLVIVSCVADPSLQDPFGGCPSSSNADAVDISVFYSPFLNATYASPTDTVALADFAFNFELTPELTSSSTTGGFPGQAYALSCLPSFNFRNISNISVILTAPFNGLPIGTDISYLLVLPNDSTLDDLRDFEDTASFFTMTLAIEPANFSQLQTQTILFLRDGSQKVFQSSSPFLRTN